MIQYPVRIASLARRFPKRSLDTLEPPFSHHQDIERLRQFWGVDSRHVIDERAGESELSLAEEAARQAMALADVRPGDIDMVLASMTTPVVGREARTGAPGWFAPRVSWFLARRLGLGDVVTSDVEVACASFLVQLQIASNAIRAGRARHVLICATERMSAILDYRSRTALPFGDGAICAVLTRESEPGYGMIESVYFSDPTHFELASVEWRDGAGENGGGEPRFTMAEDGDHALADFVPSAIPRAVERLCEKAQITLADVDSFVFHQPSHFLHESWVRRLKIPEGRCLCNVRTLGSLVSAALPMALHDSLQAGVVRPGNRLLLAGIGVGWAYGAQLWKVNGIAIENGLSAEN